MPVNALSQDKKPSMPDRELATFFRQKSGSLYLREDYSGCLQFIEDKLSFLYGAEASVEAFFAILQLHQRCYNSIKSEHGYEQYLETTLKTAGVPTIFCSLIMHPHSHIVWTTDAFSAIATTLHKQGDFLSALGYTDLMIKMNPKNADTYLLRGIIFESLHKTHSAALMFETCLKLDQTNHRASYALAVFYKNTDPKLAMEHIDNAVQNSPDIAQYHAFKGQILVSWHRYDEAVLCYENASLADIHSGEYPFQAGEILLTMKDKPAATAHFLKAIELSPNHVSCLMRLGAIFEITKPEQAVKYLKKVRRLQPNNCAAHQMLADIYRRTGNIDDAIKEFENIVASNENDHAALFALGELFVKRDAVKASDYYKKAIAIAPKLAQYHMGFAWTMELLNKPNNAIKEYLVAVSLEHNNAKAYGRLGELHAHSKPELAVEYYTFASELAPKASLYYIKKGELLLQSKEDFTEQALECYDMAVQVDPNSAPTREVLAELLEKKGHVASAAINYAAAVQLEPGLSLSHYALARIWADTQPYKALLHINTALLQNFSTGSYYHQKALILSAFAQDAYWLADLAKLSAGEGELPSELSDILQGKGLALALSAVKYAIELEPTNSTYICTGGHILFCMGQEEKALEQYRKLLKKSPDNHEALFGIGKILANAQNPKAVGYIDKAIELCPKCAKYYALKATLLAQNAKSYSAALEMYDKAIALDNQIWATVLEKAMLLEKIEQPELAIANYRRVLLVHPDCLYANVRLGEMLIESNPVAAVQYISHTIELEPEQVRHYALLGRALLLMVRDGDDDTQYSKVIEIIGDNDNTYYTVAQTICENSPQLALKYATRAFEIKPQEEQYSFLLGEIYEKLEENALATESYKTCVGINENNLQATCRLVALLAQRPDAFALEFADKATAKFPESAFMWAIMADIISGIDGEDTVRVLECMRTAVKLEPSNQQYKQRLASIVRARSFYTRAKKQLVLHRENMQAFTIKLIKNAGLIPDKITNLLNKINKK